MENPYELSRVVNCSDCWGRVTILYSYSPQAMTVKQEVLHGSVRVFKNYITSEILQSNTDAVVYAALIQIKNGIRRCHAEEDVV